MSTSSISFFVFFNFSGLHGLFSFCDDGVCWMMMMLMDQVGLPMM